MGIPGGGELFVILLIILVLFGASRLPKLARSMGQAGKEFKTGLKEGYVEQPVEGPCPFCQGVCEELRVSGGVPGVVDPTGEGC